MKLEKYEAPKTVKLSNLLVQTLPSEKCIEGGYPSDATIAVYAEFVLNGYDCLVTVVKPVFDCTRCNAMPCKYSQHGAYKGWKE